jgi:ubiquinone/menaquinone biosynthesis C-methylase UbiE
MSDAARRVDQQFRRNPDSFARMPADVDTKFLHWMVSISGVSPQDKLLDVACASGACSMAFAERCRGVVGLDVSPDAIARARAEAARRESAKVDFVAGEVERMPFADATFDAAVCRFSFHHCVHPERVFAEMARTVKPHGGWMVIVDMTAVEDPERAALHNEMERLCDPTHARTLAASEFERMFAAHGFGVTMKIARKSRSTAEDWMRFGGAPAKSAPRLRAMLEESVDGDKPGLSLIRDADTIRLIHTSVSFVLERE